jgi:hypothetical protein
MDPKRMTSASSATKLVTGPMSAGQEEATAVAPDPDPEATGVTRKISRFFDSI